MASFVFCFFVITQKSPLALQAKEKTLSKTMSVPVCSPGETELAHDPKFLTFTSGSSLMSRRWLTLWLINCEGKANKYLYRYYVLLPLVLFWRPQERDNKPTICFLGVLLLQAVSVDGVIFQAGRHNRGVEASLWPRLMYVPLLVLCSGPVLDTRSKPEL